MLSLDLSPNPSITSFGISSLLVVCSSFGFGLFVYLKGQQRRLNQLWLLFSLTVTCWGVGGFFISLARDPKSALYLWRWTLAIGVVWTPALFYHFICELCHLHRPRILRAYYLVAAISSFFYPATDLMYKGVRYVFGEFYWCVIGPFQPLFMTWWSFVVFHAHYELWKVSRQSRGITRGQIKTAFWAGFIGYTAGILEFLPDYQIDLYPWSNFAVALYPAIMTLGIFKYQMFNIRVVIRRSLVYSILITFLTVGYFGLVYGIERSFQMALGYKSVWISLSAFALMALAFQPLKIGIQRLVDWLIFRVPQEELVRRMERLEQEALQFEKLKAVSTLAAGMAHEIKNPLTAIKTFGEYLPERHNDPAFVKQFSEILDHEVNRIQRIVQELLTFAKPKPPQLKPVDLAPLINSTLNLLSGDLRKRQVQWTTNCQHNGVTFKADSDQLRQVLINLIQNAADAMPGGGNLTISTQANDGYLELIISDTGQGIPKELLPRIFDPFVTTKEHGNGLGLAMVHSIIQAHRGTIRAASTPGRGTTFTVRLPL